MPVLHEPLLELADVATSSSDLAWEAASGGAPHGSCFLVAEQTAGRGRRGAKWRSGRGGMYLSVLLRPSFSQAMWPGLSFVAGLAIREELARRLENCEVRLKWPNDVIAGEGKIGGVLLEARDGAVVVGTGVNIAPQPTMEGAKLPATSMSDFDAGGTAPQELAGDYAGNLLRRVARFGAEGFEPVRAEWLENCAHPGGRMKVQPGGRTLEGAFEGIDMDGALLLDVGECEPRRITTGDVELIGRG